MLRRIVNIFGALLIVVTMCVGLSPQPVDAAWWNTDWLYKCDITILNGAYAENLLEFPVGVFLDNTNFDFSQAQPDGDDIRFLDSDGATELDYEVVSWSAVTEYAEIWVEVPQVDASSDTDYITMYWGNDACANGEDVAGTWNTGYVAVYHMNDNPADSTRILDSTANGNTGTKKGAGEPVEAAGLVGEAQDFDGSNDYVRVANNATIQMVESMTVEVAFRSDSDFTVSQDLVAKVRYSTWYDGWALGLNTTKQLYMINARNINEGTGVIYSAANAIQPNTNYVVAGTRTRTYQTIYRDGVQLNQEVSFDAEMGNANRDLGIGIYNDNFTSRPFNGLISELRISNVARSASWIAATNKTLRDEYISYGAVSGKPLAPTNFAAVVSGNNIDLSWTKGIRADDTIIIRGENSYPTSLLDGVEVYNGAGVAFTDTGYGSEITTYYYSAFSLSEWGYSDSYTTITGGGSGMLMLGLCALALVMTMGGYIKKIPALAMGAAGFWVILAFYAYNQQSAYTNGTQYIMYSLFLISCGMAIVSALEPAIMREKVPEDLSISEASGDERPMFGYDMTRADYRQQRYMDSQPGMGIIQKQSEIERIREKSVIKLLNKNRGDRI